MLRAHTRRRQVPYLTVNHVSPAALKQDIWDNPDHQTKRMLVNASKLSLSGRSPAEWLIEADKYQQMARRFRHNPELSETFDHLAEDARERARRPAL